MFDQKFLKKICMVQRTALRHGVKGGVGGVFNDCCCLCLKAWTGKTS